MEVIRFRPELATEQTPVEISQLLAELRPDASTKELTATPEQVQAIVNDQNVVLIVARDNDRIVGMATLYMLQKFGKRTSHVEDVVVLSQYRGQGIGEKLMRTLIACAKEERVGTIHLTSRPERLAANKLYPKLGFVKKETNVYSMKL